MTLLEWFDKMDPEEKDLNMNMLQLFQMVDSKLTGKEIQVQEENNFWTSFPGPLPKANGWVAVIDANDAQGAELYFNKQLKARWAFSSMGSWCSEGTVNGKKYIAVQPRENMPGGWRQR